MLVSATSLKAEIGCPRKSFSLLLIIPTHLPKLRARLRWRVWSHGLQNGHEISVVLHWQNSLEIYSLEIARNLPSGVLRKVIHAAGISLAVISAMKLPRKSWKSCWLLCAADHCALQKLGPREVDSAGYLLRKHSNQEGKSSFPALFLQSLILCQVAKRRYLKGLAPFVQSLQ